MRGYFGIGIYHTKNGLNIGTLWRSAFNFGSAFIYTIGRRYKKQSSDTTKSWRHIPLYHHKDFDEFKKAMPKDCLLIAIEQTEDSQSLREFTHPERAVYLLGAEDQGIPKSILEKCHKIVHIDTLQCLNVAVAGSIIMFDRFNK